jgi:Tfp pilus assembly protein PilZ
MTLFGTMTNLSRSGMFLRTLPAVDAGDEVSLKFTLEHGVVTALGRVVWINHPAPSNVEMLGAPGLGIEFRQVQEGRELLQAFIERSSLIPDPERD